MRTMIKAITEVVLPAIEPSNTAALDQAKLVIGSLDMLIDQIDHAHWYEVVDIHANRDLVMSLSGVPACLADGKTIQITEDGLATAARHDVTLSELREQNRLLRDVADELIRSVRPDDTPSLAVVSDMVLQHSAGQVSRERAFVAKTRFDTEPDTLLGIRDALEKADHNGVADVISA